MSSESESEQDTFTRRGVITHSIILVVGGIVGILVDPFRRIIYNHLPDLLVRRAKIGIGYNNIVKESGEKQHFLRVSNSGRETAESVDIRLGVPQRITGYTAPRAMHAPPLTDIEVELLKDGSAAIRIDNVPPENHSDVAVPLFFQFDVDEDSSTVFEFPEIPEIEDDVLIAYRYSWTYLGEEYYETTDYHVVTQSNESE